MIIMIIVFGLMIATTIDGVRYNIAKCHYDRCSDDKAVFDCKLEGKKYTCKKTKHTEERIKAFKKFSNHSREFFVE